ncbi:type IV pilus biogenesis protein PilM [Enterobacter roggenkampii]|nr:type IV pilus biogenesis protein PilM [Enterobacter roggenkampii]
MKAMLVVAFMVLLVSFYQNSNTSNESFNESLRANAAKSFLVYTEAFDSYYSSNSTGNGDVTGKVSLPAWTPVNDDIRMYINNGYGYVFMPSEGGVLSELKKATDNSALLGVSDGTSIKTNTGTLPKPAFIPSGYIVYVR